MDLFLARLLLEVIGVTTSFALLTITFAALGMLTLPEDVLLIAAAWALLSWFGASLAITIACLGHRSELVEKLWHPTSYLLFPLSGAAFMVDWLPPQAREYALLVPMIHGVEILRDGFFGSAVRAHYDIEYVLASCMLLSLLAAALMRDVARRVVPE